MAAAAPACGVLDLSCHVAGAVDSWFTGLVTSAVSPLFALIGRTLLTTPQAGQFAAGAAPGRLTLKVEEPAAMLGLVEPSPTKPLTAVGQGEIPYLWARYGGIRLGRPAHVAASLREAMDAILSLLDIRHDSGNQ